MSKADTNRILSVRDLHISIDGANSRFEVVSGVNFDIHRGKTLGIVGESGCGKSITAAALMRLLPKPVAHIDRGAINFGGMDIARASLQQLYEIRGDRIAMVFQEPMAALNPVMRVGDQVAEVLIQHKKLKSGAEADKRAVELFAEVGIPAPASRVRDFPHQLSGGMRQRVMIAMALACGPDLLIADEPTTALDVTIQAQILKLINRLKQKTGMAVLLVSHDLGLIGEYTDDLAVMYAGQIVESGPTEEIMLKPRHPYTRALLESRPELDTVRKSRLQTIEGSVPHASQWPKGCRFHTRCKLAIAKCSDTQPLPEHPTPERMVHCHRWSEV
jgi:oligopeptide/dipeptide ABC transporter ATP-binding protein